MRKNLIWPGVGFLILYYLLRVAYRLPVLIHHSGIGRYGWLHGSLYGVLPRLIDLGIGFAFVLIPYLVLSDYYPTRKWGRAILLLLVMLPTVYGIGFWWSTHHFGRIRLRDHFNAYIFFYGVYVLYGAIAFFIQYTRQKEREQQELLLLNQQAELSFLRSQINPHFLFNNLNTIYTLVYYKNEQALPAIAGLSDILRFMLYDSSEFVSLEKELAYLEKYIDLQRLRFEGDSPVKMECSRETHQWQVPPLLFLPIIENAFKHGVIDNGNKIFVRLDVGPDQLSFYCYNRRGDRSTDGTGGVGLGNIRRRLALLYPGRHSFRVDEGKEDFTVNLQLQHG